MRCVGPSYLLPVEDVSLPSLIYSHKESTAAISSESAPVESSALLQPCPNTRHFRKLGEASNEMGIWPKP